MDVGGPVLGDSDVVRPIDRRGESVRIHVGHAELVPEMIRYFERQPDCVVLQVGATEIEVSLLGSYRSDRHEQAVERLLAEFWLQSADPRQPHRANGHN